MAFPFINIRTGSRVPSKMITNSASFIAAYTGSTCSKCVLIHQDITAIEYVNSYFAVDKYITGTDCTFGNLEKETAFTRPCLHSGEIPVEIADTFHPVIKETSVHITNIIPDPV